MRIGPIILFAVLAACTDPPSGIERLSDQDLPIDQPSTTALPLEQSPDAGGFLGRILNAEKTPPLGEEAADTAANDASLAGSAAEPTAKPRGLLSLFRPAVTPTTVQKEAFPAAPQSGTEDDAGVTVGTILPFGEVAKVCAAKRRDLGKKIEALSGGGVAMFDSKPGTFAKRSFYLTGFKDGCARQFTAANVIATPPSRYEAYRFGPASQHMPLGATDRAYDKIKRGVCGVAKGQPCGNRISRLDRQMTFLSAYEFYEGNAQWFKVLINDGQMVATALKKP